MSIQFFYNGYCGWEVESVSNLYRVYKRVERLRVDPDGVWCFGEPLEEYWFNTKEWADLCAKSLSGIDGEQPAFSFDSSGNLGVGFSASAYNHTGYQFNMAGTMVARWDDNKVTMINLPYLIKVWYKSTCFHKFLLGIWYGDSYRSRS